MKVRRLDSNWDMTFGQGLGNYLSDSDAVGQVILTRLKLLLGEWWEDTTQGLPLWESMLGAVGTKKEMIDRIIQSNILGTIGVTGISFLNTSFDSTTGNYIFYCEVNTVYGTVIVSNI